jgi:aryl-alcohol dehydrogenase-like predicted oxidoreductase
VIAGAGGRGYRGPNATTLPAVSRNVGVVDNRAEIREFLTTRHAKITPSHWPGYRPSNPWIASIPGTRRRERLQENGATEVALSADEVADLDTTAARIGVHGNRYNDMHMSLVGR